MSVESFSCQKCNWAFMFAMCEADALDDLPPNYCPRCGKVWEKTPAGIVEEIKSEYHRLHPYATTGISGDDEKMEKLLNKLKEMAEANER